MAQKAMRAANDAYFETRQQTNIAALGGTSTTDEEWKNRHSTSLLVCQPPPQE